MGSPAKVLFIGIDAGDKDLIQQWSSDGHLPTFRKLFRSSAWSITNSPPGLYVGAIWPSFYTGVSPARHARYCFRQLVPGSYDVQWISPRDVRHEPFWDALDRSGKRVAVIDVPKTYPSRLANGIQIVDWGSHDPDAAGFCTWPESVAPEIETRYDPDSMHCCNAFRTTGEEFRDFRDHLIERIRKKTALSAAWLAKGDWDCFLTVYSESHCVGHQCWHLHDHGHQKFDPQLLEAAGNPILAVYQAVDSGIAELLEQAGDDAHVVVFASHGMGPHYDATFMLDDILLRLEGAPQARKRDALAPLAKTLWKLLPRQVRDAARPVRDKARYNLGVDESAQRARRRCFAIPNNDAYGGIRINLAGREPAGLVAECDYDAFCDALSRDLMSFTNVTTGEPLVNAVLRSRELYSGEHLHHLPDLLVEWNRSAPVSEVSSPGTGRITGTYSKCRTGDHRAEGLCFVAGPRIAPGQLQQPVSVTDLAPTIAALAGVELDNVDGSAVASLIAPR